MFGKTPLVIIGMHRSGTTMLTQVLERAGVMMGHDFTAYHESNFFQRCNDAVLHRANATWDEPAVTNEAPADFNTRHLLTEYAGLRSHPTAWWPMLFNKHWGWKDPRNTFTLGSWLKVFPDLHVIHICRNGIDVARSLYERNAMLQPESKWHSEKLNDLTQCFALWEAYVKQALSWKSVLGKRYTMVRYEDLLAMKPDVVELLELFCGRKLKHALDDIVNRERRSLPPLTNIEALHETARNNQTFFRLGYVV